MRVWYSDELNIGIKNFPTDNILSNFSTTYLYTYVTVLISTASEEVVLGDADIRYTNRAALRRVSERRAPFQIGEVREHRRGSAGLEGRSLEGGGRGGEEENGSSGLHVVGDGKDFNL